jgi:hypothetical protein
MDRLVDRLISQFNRTSLKDPGLIGSALLCLLISVVAKRRYFSSISDVPGPFVASFTILWQIYHAFKGHTELEMVKLHKEYGHHDQSGLRENH